MKRTLRGIATRAPALNAPQLTAHPDFNPCLNHSEAADYLRVHPKTLDRIVAEGRLAVVRRDAEGSHRRYRVSALNAYLDSLEIAPRVARTMDDIDWGAA